MCFLRRACALSDPKDKDYQIICPHDHLDTCDRCELLASVLADIHGALETFDSNMSRDVIEEMVFNEGQAEQNILAWKAHLLRYVNQDEARLEVTKGGKFLKKLEVTNAVDESSVLLEQDWVMKFLPRKFQWTGSKDLHMMVIVHFFQTFNRERHWKTEFPLESGKMCLL